MIQRGTNINGVARGMPGFYEGQVVHSVRELAVGQYQVKTVSRARDGDTDPVARRLSSKDDIIIVDYAVKVEGGAVVGFITDSSEAKWNTSGGLPQWNGSLGCGWANRTGSVNFAELEQTLNLSERALEVAA